MNYKSILSKRLVIIITITLPLVLSCRNRNHLIYDRETKDYSGFSERTEVLEEEEDDIITICNLRYNKTEHRIYESNGKLITDSIDWIYNDMSGECIVPFSRNDKRGFINIEKSAIHIAPKYDHAWVYREGLAAVAKDGKLFFIDKNDSIQIKGFDFVRNKDFFFKQGLAMAGRDSLVGLINKESRWIIGPMYDYIRFIDERTIHAILPSHRVEVFSYKGKKTDDCYIKQIMINEVNSNIFIYESDNGWFGLMDSKGKRITEPLYQRILFVKNNIICYNDNNQYDIYSRSGNLIFKNIMNVQFVSSYVDD